MPKEPKFPFVLTLFCCKNISFQEVTTKPKRPKEWGNSNYRKKKTCHKQM